MVLKVDGNMHNYCTVLYFIKTFRNTSCMQLLFLFVISWHIMLLLRMWIWLDLCLGLARPVCGEDLNGVALIQKGNDGERSYPINSFKKWAWSRPYSHNRKMCTVTFTLPAVVQHDIEYIQCEIQNVTSCSEMWPVFTWSFVIVHCLASCAHI